MPDFRGQPVRLGRKAVKRDTRTLRLARYMTGALPTPPPSVDWSKGFTDFGMMLNDKLGCCTISGAGHAIQVWTANNGPMTTVPDSAILSAYEQWDGYNPSDPSTDQGGVELDVLNDWRKNGLDGHEIDGYAYATIGSQTEIQQAIYLFGGLYIGVELPNVAFQQSVWDVTPDDGGIAGGHCVYIVGYDAEGLTCITWGKLQKMTWAWWAKYVDEAYAILSPDWIDSTASPSGFNLTQLQNDINAIQ